MTAAIEEKIWVELEIASGDSVTGYNGLIAVADYEALEHGTLQRPFVKLSDVHWYRLTDQDGGWKRKELIEYGAGQHTEYGREALIRSDIILTVFKLRHGPRDPNP